MFDWVHHRLFAKQTCAGCGLLSHSKMLRLLVLARITRPVRLRRHHSVLESVTAALASSAWLSMNVVRITDTATQSRIGGL
jgi:hypothetical protein